MLQVKIDHTFNCRSEHRKTLSKVLPLVILPPTILLPPASTYTTFPHGCRPNRTGLLGRLRSGTERVPKIPPFGLDGFCAPAAATATFVDEFVEGIRSAFRAGLDGLADGEGGLAGLGGEVGFCDLWG